MSNGSREPFHRWESVPGLTRRLVEMLDHVEERVELLREHASAVESERDDLLRLLASVGASKDMERVTEGEKEEIEITVQRLLNRTLTVQASVTTPRNEIQQKALDNVNKMCNNLVTVMESDLANAQTVWQQYMNACLSDCSGPINQKFQVGILECTADDQKLVRKRFESLLNCLLLQNPGRT